MNVNVRSGMTFARGLRAILRQDPDVVLVGEIRDKETAELALRASLTGHLVLSTVHTNGAVQALTRLVDMEIPPFLVASSLNLVVAQRLVRRVCSECSEPHVPTDEILAALAVDLDTLTQANPRRGAGCLKCGMTGYRGRLGRLRGAPGDRQAATRLRPRPHRGDPPERRARLHQPAGGGPAACRRRRARPSRKSFASRRWTPPSPP